MGHLGAGRFWNSSTTRCELKAAAGGAVGDFVGIGFQVGDESGSVVAGMLGCTTSRKGAAAIMETGRKPSRDRRTTFLTVNGPVTCEPPVPTRMV